MKFAICNELFEGWPIEKVFKTAADLGYDGVEIAPFTLAGSVDDIPKSKRKEIAGAAESHGIEIVGLHWLLVKPEGMYINHPDEDVRLRTRKYLDSLIRFCGDVGGRILVFGSPKQRSVFQGLTREQAWDYARETFSHCADTARKVGVYLCIEALSPKETDFINTITEALKMVREVGKPNFRTMIDIKAISSDGRPLPEIIEEGGALIEHVHANERDGRGPGTGSTDFHEVAAALRKIRYNKFVSVEVFEYRPDPITISKSSLACLTSAFRGAVVFEGDELLYRDTNGPAYVKGQKRTGPPLGYVGDKLRHSLQLAHSLYQEIRESVPDDLPQPEGARGTSYSTKEDGLVGPAYEAFSYQLTAFLALYNMLGLDDNRLANRLLRSSYEEFDTWLRRIIREGSVTG
jgi:sugar phosphate isomerase/epimerase